MLDAILDEGRTAVPGILIKASSNPFLYSIQQLHTEDLKAVIQFMAMQITFPTDPVLD